MDKDNYFDEQTTTDLTFSGDVDDALYYDSDMSIDIDMVISG